jgi:hypothetical protein
MSVIICRLAPDRKRREPSRERQGKLSFFHFPLAIAVFSVTIFTYI